ncbi:hypothetical protein N7489_008051 [Penicillium chrysogenum]|uniref:Uncharacterized protein n=1 Tax=Penicillium chrysogenum TaxID=5076 RepID=A0ABQ8WAJ0_PENCH|nr:uncharacterized protein N7489_008051 [Penicillium chrysogenum]KAJ5237960.1 hypothetical protein N7489_008051 [Penicillium chrysogenum]KAJ5261783.1 hypothetical protein N7505_008650 [Penicillium chrysogenum]KAJ5278259.1 hypothetical protein N7524_004412 [Penicillium chrysogenum]KAJ6159709.1 hypothetical protein N7497_004246 [Penicillium chrysogenum]
MVTNDTDLLVLLEHIIDHVGQHIALDRAYIGGTKTHRVIEPYGYSGAELKDRIWTEKKIPYPTSPETGHSAGRQWQGDQSHEQGGTTAGNLHTFRVRTSLICVHREGLTRLGIQLRVLGAGVDPKFGECDRIEAADSVHRANQADWEGLRLTQLLRRHLCDADMRLIRQQVLSRIEIGSDSKRETDRQRHCGYFFTKPETFVIDKARKKVYYSRSGPRSREGQTLRNPSMQHWRI